MEHVEQFLKSGLYLRAWSPKRVRTYRHAFSSLQQSLQSNRSPSVDGSSPTKARLEAWVVWLKEKGVSSGGCNMYIRTVNSYLSWLHDEGLARRGCA